MIKKFCTAFIFFMAIILTACNTNAQIKTSIYIVNDETVDTAIIHQLEKTYGVKCVPGNYWYDKFTGAFGLKGGPCTGIGVAGINIGGTLKADASGGGSNIFINGRDLHPQDVAGLQTFMQPLPGRYWMDASGNFGYENFPYIIGNIYVLWNAKFGSGGSKKSASYKNNVWSGETTSFGSDGTFMYYSSKKTDGTTYDYSN